MTYYSLKPRDRIFVKGYGFLSFPKSMNRNIGKKAKNIKTKNKNFCFRKCESKKNLHPGDRQFCILISFLNIF